MAAAFYVQTPLQLQDRVKDCGDDMQEQQLLMVVIARH